MRHDRRLGVTLLLVGALFVTGPGGAQAATIAVGTTVDELDSGAAGAGPMVATKRYPFRGTVSMKRGAARSSPSAARSSPAEIRTTSSVMAAPS